jgi:penicillin-binding protein 2
MSQPEFKDYSRENRHYCDRAIVAGLLVVVLIGLLIARMAYLQILSHEHFTTLAQDNRVKLIPLPPTRGLIYDRNGVLLAENRPVFSMEIIPERVDDLSTTIDALNKIIEIKTTDIERFHKLRRHKRRFDSIPIRVNISLQEAALFSVKQHKFPGVAIKAQLSRIYPQADITSHALGYVGRVSKKDLQSIVASEYAGTSHIGKIGVEKSYESILHGKVGLEKVEVNALGKKVRVLEQVPPEPGKSLRLHIDVELQEIALDAFGDRNGALVAIDPNNGGVLALVSKPGYNPNLFVEGISSKDYKTLQQDENKPLYNRALRGQYPPGSTVKPFMGLAGLQTQKISSDTNLYCPGYFRLPGHNHKYRDWKKGGHGTVNLDIAITQSCDTFFYKLATDIGIDQLQEYLAHFKFGDKTGIDLTGEKKGVRPSRQYKKKRYPKQAWYPGETVITGIGQGYFLTTPLQLAAATAAIANGGIYFTPRVVAEIIDEATDQRTPIRPISSQVPIDNPAYLADIRQAMANVVETPRGTAKRIRSENYRIAGKTGTAQVFTVKQDEEYDEEKIAEKMRDHALFIAYAPIDDPQIAIAVIVEHGGHGGSVAAPIARQIMDAYLLGANPHIAP